MRLEGKLALVTGGASGIGEAVVRRFVREGATVIFTDVNAPAGAALAQAVNARYEQRDVASEPDWAALIALVEQEFGGLDILVNNAGVVSHQSIAETELPSWQRIIDTNITGAMLGCRGAIALMQRGAGGSIINVASTVSFLGLSNDAAYTTSKAAVVGLTRSVAAWCAKAGTGIRCNSVHPGTTRTPILVDQIEKFPELQDKFCQMSPMHRMGEPDEVANLVLYLASDESSYSTGGQFVVDGGMVNTHPAMDI